jgi:hypothetical protein
MYILLFWRCPVLNKSNDSWRGAEDAEDTLDRRFCEGAAGVGDMGVLMFAS